MEKGNLALTLMIPDVSLLLIYKDNWNKSAVMRKVIAEILRNGFYRNLHLGHKIDSQFSNCFSDFKDCAIISLKLSAGQNLGYDEPDTARIFSKELENPKNVLHFNSEMWHEANQVSYIEIEIKITKTAEDPNAAQAA